MAAASGPNVTLPVAKEKNSTVNKDKEEEKNTKQDVIEIWLNRLFNETNGIIRVSLSDNTKKTLVKFICENNLEMPSVSTENAEKEQIPDIFLNLFIRFVQLFTKEDDNDEVPSVIDPKKTYKVKTFIHEKETEKEHRRKKYETIIIDLLKGHEEEEIITRGRHLQIDKHRFDTKDINVKESKQDTILFDEKTKFTNGLAYKVVLYDKIDKLFFDSISIIDRNDIEQTLKKYSFKKNRGQRVQTYIKVSNIEDVILSIFSNTTLKKKIKDLNNTKAMKMYETFKKNEDSLRDTVFNKFLRNTKNIHDISLDENDKSIVPIHYTKYVSFREFYNQTYFDSYFAHYTKDGGYTEIEKFQIKTNALLFMYNLLKPSKLSSPSTVREIDMNRDIFFHFLTTNLDCFPADGDDNTTMNKALLLSYLLLDSSFEGCNYTDVVKIRDKGIDLEEPELQESKNSIKFALLNTIADVLSNPFLDIFKEDPKRKLEYNSILTEHQLGRLRLQLNKRNKRTNNLYVKASDSMYQMSLEHSLELEKRRLRVQMIDKLIRTISRRQEGDESENDHIGEISAYFMDEGLLNMRGTFQLTAKNVLIRYLKDFSYQIAVIYQKYAEIGMETLLQMFKGIMDGRQNSSSSSNSAIEKEFINISNQLDHIQKIIYECTVPITHIQQMDISTFVEFEKTKLVDTLKTKKNEIIKFFSRIKDAQTARQEKEKMKERQRQMEEELKRLEEEEEEQQRLKEEEEKQQQQEMESQKKQLEEEKEKEKLRAIKERKNMLQKSVDRLRSSPSEKKNEVTDKVTDNIETIFRDLRDGLSKISSEEQLEEKRTKIIKIITKKLSNIISKLSHKKEDISIEILKGEGQESILSKQKLNIVSYLMLDNDDDKFSSIMLEQNGFRYIGEENDIKNLNGKSKKDIQQMIRHTYLDNAARANATAAAGEEGAMEIPGEE